MIAKVYITLKPGVLDPQGQAVQRSLARLGFPEVRGARIGKYIEVEIDGDPAQPEVREKLDRMCRDLLANTVVEDYRYELPTHGDGKSRAT
jgi:phosphoribosylformylglycinamidine synthase